MIYWRDDYRIGIDYIDDQHKELFSIAEEIYNLFNDIEGPDKSQEIANVLKELKEYTISHFSLEEDFMREINYNNYNSHRLAHTKFIEKINSVDLNDFNSTQNEQLLELLEFIIKWLYLHILSVDKELSAAQFGTK